MKIARQMLELVCPGSREEWREWLRANHAIKTTVWLVCHKKHTRLASTTWYEAVDEALCFGWIDCTSRPIDEDKFMQFFSRRKPDSTWSKINKEKTLRLSACGMMTAAGQHGIDIAKENGSWEILDTVKALIVPADPEQRFSEQPGAKTYFNSLSKSVKKSLLQWLVLFLLSPIDGYN